MTILTLDRCRGAIVGLAIGDAIGTTLEFRKPGTFDPVADMIGGGPFRLQPGEWTDDTSMALCLAESLIECRGFDPRDQMTRYLKWFREGYLSSTGKCFDIGVTVRNALFHFEETGEPYSGSTDPMTAGNGSIMRLAPVSIFFGGDLLQAVEYAAMSSRSTHGATEAIDACRLFSFMMVKAFRGYSKEDILHFEDGAELFNPPLVTKIADIAAGSYKKLNPPAIQGLGYVVRSLEAALWAFYNSDTFEEGVLKAVNLGDDSDTTGAVLGQLAGLYYGINAIPERWIEKVKNLDFLLELADQLHESYVKRSEDVTSISRKSEGTSEIVIRESRTSSYDLILTKEKNPDLLTGEFRIGIYLSAADLQQQVKIIDLFREREMGIVFAPKQYTIENIPIPFANWIKADIMPYEDRFFLQYLSRQYMLDNDVERSISIIEDSPKAYPNVQIMKLDLREKSYIAVQDERHIKKLVPAIEKAVKRFMRKVTSEGQLLHWKHI